jgi:hypothetical protein
LTNPGGNAKNEDPIFHQQKAWHLNRQGQQKEGVQTMVKMIYASVIAEDCGPQDVNDILQVSRKHNEENGITGILCYDGTYFVQWIEGARDKVNTLYGTILHDQRHRNVVILEYAEIAKREFGSWSMAYVSTANADQKTIFKYCAKGTFNPYSMSPESVRLLLLDLACDHEAILGRAVDW